jgi:hypothetical protein
MKCSASLCSASLLGGSPTRLPKMVPRGMSVIQRRTLLREGFSLDTKTTGLE